MNLTWNILKQKLIGKAAEQMVLMVDSPPTIAPVTKSLSESRVALVTSAGVLLKNQPVFDCQKGDSSFRSIPDGISPSELMISHTHYDHSEADQDINCVFPLERLHELAAEGVIGSAASVHYSFMGYIPNPKNLIEKTAPDVAARLIEDGVDIVVLSPG